MFTIRAFIPCLFVISLAGCAARPVQIPIGRWTGQGTFAYERWKPANKAESLQREYPTRLTTRRAQFDGRPAVEMEILSEHGGLPGLGDDKATHLRMMLVEERRPCDCLVLYRVAGMDPHSDKPPEFEPDAPPVSATCFRTKDALLMHIVYGEGFVDSLRFRGKGLTKSGSFTDDSQTIHWAETLYQVGPVDTMSTSMVPFR